MSGELESATLEAGIEAARAACLERGLRFTAVRRAVLQTLMRAGQPLGAYDIISHLEVSLGRKLPAQSVYRALDFLLEQHLAARIESKNAFIACANPHHPHACVFLLCGGCGASRELEDAHIEKLFDRAAASFGFQISRPVVELQGTCIDCRNKLEREPALA